MTKSAGRTLASVLGTAALAVAVLVGPPAAARSHGSAAPAYTPGPDETPNPSGLYLPKTVPTARPAAEAKPSPAGTPTSPAFTTLDGTWEIQVQRGARTTYEHFSLKQAGSAVTGTWNVDKKTAVPVTGTYDGHNFKFVAETKAGPVTMTGYIDDSADMVGAYPEGKGLTAFTASHRKKASNTIGVAP